MRHFLSKLILFIAICAVPIISLSLTKERDKVTYSRKRQILEDNKDATCVIMGTSHATYGFDPGVFSFKTINIAEPMTPIEFDMAIIEKYLNELKGMKFLVLPMDYFTLTFSDSLALLNDFVIKYAHHWGIKEVLHSRLDFYNLNNYHFYTCGLNLFEKESKWSATDLGNDPQTGTFLGLDSLNREEYTKERLDYWKKHFIGNDKKSTAKISGDIIQFVRLLESKNITVYFVALPISTIMYKYFDPAVLKINNDFIGNLVQTTKARYVNLQDSSIFKNTNLFFDEDHLNDSGARVASRYVNSYLVKDCNK